MKPLLIIFLLFVIALPVQSWNGQQDSPVEVSTGMTTLFYQSVYSFQSGSAFTTAVRGNLTDSWHWQAGIRMAFSPSLFDGFIRVLAVPKLGRWRPAVGFELGVTNRARFDKGEKLLREARASMEGDISNGYIGVHAMPLSFKIRKVWRISIAEMNVGTHLGNTGKTMRVQFGFFTLGRTL